MTRFRRSGHFRTSNNGVWHYVRGHDVERDDWGHQTSWAVGAARRPITHPTQCWWCGAAVYFYRDQNGGCALFNELGAPWDVHSCWEAHRNEQDAAYRAEAALRDHNIEGPPDPDDYEQYVSPSRGIQLWPFWGILLNIEDADAWPGGWHEYSVELSQIQILFEDKVYTSLTPSRIAEKATAGMPIRAELRCTYVSREPILLTTGLEQRDLKGRLLWRGSVAALANGPITCNYCGRRVRPAEGWGLTDRERVECGGCRLARGDLSPTQFIAVVRRIARHLIATPR